MPDSDQMVVSQTSDLRCTWKAAPPQWGHSLHRLAPYVGSFPPELAHYFIRWFSEPGDTVLDPFCGRGTTPLQAALLNRQAIGNDAFSYANILSTAKCNPMTTERFREYLYIKLAESEQVNNANMRLLENKDLRVFYSDYTLDQLLRLREVLRYKETVEAQYLKAIVCGILHGPSEMYLSLQTKDTIAGSVRYVRDYAEEHDLERPEKDIQPNALRNHEHSIKSGVPEGVSDRTCIVQTDARSLPFERDSVDLIVTSPPYMHVLSYSWNNWIRLWWLGKNRKDERDSLDITADVDKYRSFMRECLGEMSRLLVDDGRVVLVVGDVNKHLSSGKHTLNTARIIAKEAVTHTEFTVSGIIEDAYDVDSRGYVTFNQIRYNRDEDETKEKAMVPIDRCLILSKGTSQISPQPTIDWELENFDRNGDGAGL